MQVDDKDPQETREWLESLDSVLKYQGRGRTAFLLKTLAEHAAQAGTKMPAAITTPFRNSIEPTAEKRMPGDLFMERRIRSLIRWNALAMVVRNLVENAVRHGKEAGFVQVTLSSVDGRVVLRVLDDGPGIPEDKLPLAFERFTRFATDGAGSGLGLSIVERIAEIHDATVTLRNRAEEGLVCEMSLSGAGLVVSKG